MKRPHKYLQMKKLEAEMSYIDSVIMTSEKYI